MRVPIILAVLVLACGCGSNEHGDPVLWPRRDTVAYEAELRAAREMLLTGETVLADTIAGQVLRDTEGKPALFAQRITAFSILGQVRQRRSELDSALALYAQGLQLAEAVGDTGWIGGMWLNTGVALDLKGDYKGALKAQLNALRWTELDDDPKTMARVLHNLSVLYWRQDSTPRAIELLQRSLTYKRQYDTLNLSSGLNGLGVLLIETGRYDSAVVVLKESLVLEDRLLAGAERENALTNLGLAFERAGRLDSAAYYYQAALHDAERHANHELAVRALYGLGDVRRAQGRSAEARTLLDSSLALAVRIGSLEDIREAHLSLVMLHERMHEPDAALAHFRAYHELSDSLMNAGIGASMEELRLRYDTEKKDRENQELRAAQELTTLRAERNRWIAIGLGVLVIAGVVFAWSIVQRNRQRAHQREAELEQQALRLQMDPHFLFNALNTVPGLYATGDVLAANDHVGDLSRFLRLVLETSRRRTIPLDQELELVERYLRISANRRPGTFTWDMKVMPYVRAERLAIPPMLIQPIVENAIEHGLAGTEQGHVSILVDRAGSVLHIEVKDNGPGRSANAQRPKRRDGRSMGIDLVRRRIALFDKRTSLSEAVVLEDAPQGGTLVTIRLRIHELNEHAAAGDRG